MVLLCFIHNDSQVGVLNSRPGRALVPGMAADGDFESHEPFERAMLRLRCVLTRFDQNLFYAILRILSILMLSHMVTHAQMEVAN